MDSVVGDGLGVRTKGDLMNDSRLDGEEVDEFYDHCGRFYHRLAADLGNHEPNLHHFKKDSRIWLHKNRRGRDEQRGNREVLFKRILETEDPRGDFIYSVVDQQGRRFKKDSRTWLHKTSYKRRFGLERDDRAKSDPVELSRMKKLMEYQPGRKKYVLSDSRVTDVFLPPGVTHVHTVSSLETINRSSDTDKRKIGSRSMDSILPSGKFKQQKSAPETETVCMDLQVHDTLVELFSNETVCAARHTATDLRTIIGEEKVKKVSMNFPPAISLEKIHKEVHVSWNKLHDSNHPSMSQTSIATQHDTDVDGSDESYPVVEDIGLRKSTALLPRYKVGYNSQAVCSCSSSCSECAMQAHGDSLTSMPSLPDVRALNLDYNAMDNLQDALNVCNHESERDQFPKLHSSSSNMNLSLVEHLL